MSEELEDATVNMKEELDRISKLVFIDESLQGIYRPPDALYSKMRGTYSITGADQPLTENQIKQWELYLSAASETIDMIDGFLEKNWKSYRELVIAENISFIE